MDRFSFVLEVEAGVLVGCRIVDDCLPDILDLFMDGDLVKSSLAFQF